MAKAKKEEEKLQQLETQIILAKHEKRSNYLAEHLTWADIETALAEGKLKGVEKMYRLTNLTQNTTNV